MKVIALEAGFYGGRPVPKGATFEVPEGSKARWYAPADGSAGKAAAAKQKAGPTKQAAAPATLSEIGKDQPKSFVDVNAKDDAASGDKVNLA